MQKCCHGVQSPSHTALLVTKPEDEKYSARPIKPDVISGDYAQNFRQPSAGLKVSALNELTLSLTIYQKVNGATFLKLKSTS